MATIRYYLDVRRHRADGASALKIAVTSGGKRGYVPTGISLRPEQWDDAGRRVTAKHRLHRTLNSALTRWMLLATDAVLRLEIEGIRRHEAFMEAVSLAVRGADEEAAAAPQRKVGTFLTRFREFAASPLKRPRTRELYNSTISRICAFDADADTLDFEDVTRQWLVRFDEFMAPTAPSPNARAIHMRNIRAVFNDAINDEITTNYPFRRFKIRSRPTRKRALPVESLRRLFDWPAEPNVRRYIDAFKLTFLLCGINVVDLCHLENITADGRVEYERAKTGRPYSLKVEPEAAEIIRRYAGSRFLLDYLDTVKDYRSFAARLNKTIQELGKERQSGPGAGTGRRKEGRAVFPGVTTYWARHSWATVAASLDIPKETIAAALGHSSHSVTDIYIDFDTRKIDEANRRVIDWVLYGRK